MTPVSSNKRGKNRQTVKKSRMSKGGYIEELSLPQALGQALTPSNIRIQSQIGRTHAKATPSVDPAGVSPAEKKRIHAGSVSNPENIGLQTSAVHLIQPRDSKQKEKLLA
jgi:hypothetical protein